MLIVGLTGGFGTGKSYVASVFRSLGAKVVDADKLAHAALKTGTAEHGKVVAEFGSSILNPDGSIDRKALGRIVFQDKQNLGRLNRIVHPYVIGKIKASLKKAKKGILIIDAALIFETGLEKLMHFVVVVKASRQKQISRCIERFNMKEKDVCKRMACQMPLKTKIKKADYVIDNDGTRMETKKQVIQLWKEIKKGAK